MVRVLVSGPAAIDPAARPCGDRSTTGPGARKVARRFPDVAEPLLEQPRDVLVVERVEDHPPVAARTDQPHAAKQAKLVGYGGFAEVEQRRKVADAQLRVRERIEDPHARGVSQNAEGVGERRNIAAADEGFPEARYDIWMSVERLAGGVVGACWD